MSLAGTQTGDQPPAGDPPAGEEPATGSAATGMSAEQVRNSPEYRELQKQNRTLARRAGDSERSAAEARAESERQRQAAEDAQRESQSEAIAALLGDEGVAAWQEIAELSSTDPVAAAKKFAELSQARATPATAPAATTQTGDEGGAEVPTTQSGTPPMPSGSVDAGSPLASIVDPGEDDYIKGLEKTFNDVVEENMAAPNRMTLKRRAEGMIAYVEASYRKAFRERRASR